MDITEVRNQRTNLKNNLILFDDKSHFHSANGPFSSTNKSLSSSSPFLDFSWKAVPDPCVSDHFLIAFQNEEQASIQREETWNLTKANRDQLQQLCSAVCSDLLSLMLIIQCFHFHSERHRT